MVASPQRAGERIVRVRHRTADYYGLTAGEAKRTAAEVARATGEWRSEAARLGIGGREIERMASAFVHDDYEGARRGRAT